MALVIADTGPIHYLILVEQIDLLPALFTKAVIPTIVQSELLAARTPDPVRNWILHPPHWLDILIAPDFPFEDKISRELDNGEKAAIALATSLHADLLLMDERKGAMIARKHGLTVTGTLGVLDLAAQ